MTKENFSQTFNKFFSEKDLNIFRPNRQIFICRGDGILLYQEGSISKKNDNFSIGALMGGVWQAARELASFLPQESEQEVFRLSFDTSSRGVYILPFQIKDQEYYLGAIYFGEDNPAKTKAYLRQCLDKLENFMENSELTNTRQGDKKAEYLFKDISDGEMDDLFSIHS